MKLRKEMGTFGNLRPCFLASDSLAEISPLKAEIARGTNFMIVRELTGGVYFGDRIEDDGSGFAQDTEPYSRAEIERVTRLGAYLALAEDPPAPVWSLDKANVLATSRLWRKTVTDVMQKEFPQLKLQHQLIDSAAMIMVKSPRALNGVIITSNLFGDIISDEASVIPGSLGLLPSASLASVPDGKGKCNGIYEPIHGKFRLSERSRTPLTVYRLRTRYQWQGNCKPSRNNPVNRHDAQVFSSAAKAGITGRPSSEDRDRQRHPHERHWWICHHH